MNALAHVYAMMTVIGVKIEDRKNDRGASMVEYALLVAGMAVVVGIAVGVFGDEIKAFIEGINLTADDGTNAT